MIKRKSLIAWVALVAMMALPFSIAAQTQLKYHSNKFSIQDDVKLGRQAAQEAEQQFPLLNDAQVQSYVERVGERLVAAIPQQFRHPEFDYFFKVINARDINAFALPGGPMYVNRGMIEAARSEGEMAGVMAHEISHVALRHGTAQATKGQKYGTLAAIAGIAGTILTRNPNVGQLAQAPFAVYLLKFSREYETEADILGAQMMAAAGYDPRDLANMFRTIEQQGGGSSGGFLSSHPSPSDRYARINREAQMLRVDNSVRDDSREFARVQERLRGHGAAPSMEEIARSGQRNPRGENTSYPDRAPAGRVEYPSTRYQNVSIFNGGVRVNVPANWRQLDQGSSVWFVPEGGYGSVNGQAVFTHGASFGVIQPNNRNLQRATDELISGLAQGNRNLRASGNYQRTTLDGRNALWATLSNVNEATGGPETIRLITTQLRNGQLFYMVAVAPQNERAFDNAFNQVLRSLRINDR
ncbi:MAG: M48 family metalloprotease [Acidobacteria bacterium]|nr:M48 family metalloprotease [Acidobacteriota bacterium]